MVWVANIIISPKWKNFHYRKKNQWVKLKGTNFVLKIELANLLTWEILCVSPWNFSVWNESKTSVHAEEPWFQPQGLFLCVRLGTLYCWGIFGNMNLGKPRWSGKERGTAGKWWRVEINWFFKLKGLIAHLQDYLLFNVQVNSSTLYFP